MFALRLRSYLLNNEGQSSCSWSPTKNNSKDPKTLVSLLVGRTFTGAISKVTKNITENKQCTNIEGRRLNYSEWTKPHSKWNSLRLSILLLFLLRLQQALLMLVSDNRCLPMPSSRECCRDKTAMITAVMVRYAIPPRRRRHVDPILEGRVGISLVTKWPRRSPCIPQCIAANQTTNQKIETLM